MIRRIKQMKFKSSFSMSEFIRINHIKQDIVEVETHGDDIVLHYYINIQEDNG